MASVKAKLIWVMIFLLELATTVKKLNSLLFMLLMFECILTWYYYDKHHKKKEITEGMLRICFFPFLVLATKTGF